MAKAKKAIASTTVDAVLTFSGALQFKKALINGVKLTFHGNEARFSATPAIEHTLSWEVVGFVGTKWSFKLKSDTEGFAVDPKKLSDPGKSFELERPEEKKKFTFTLARAEES